MPRPNVRCASSSRRWVLPSASFLKFAACGLLSTDFTAFISDTLTGFYSVMDAMMGDEKGEQPAQFASLASLGAVWRKCVSTSDQQTNEKKKLDENSFRIQRCQFSSTANFVETSCGPSSTRSFLHMNWVRSVSSPYSTVCGWACITSPFEIIRVSGPHLSW